MVYKKLIFLFSVVFFTYSCSNNSPIRPNIPEKLLNYAQYSDKSFKKFIVKHSSYKIQQNTIDNLSGMVKYHSKITGIDPKLVLSLIARESAFKTTAISSAGAKGLGQLMPYTARQMGVSNVFDAEDNIKGTTRYLSWLKKRTKSNNLDVILASYNMGPAAVESYLKRKKIFPAEVREYIYDIKSYYKTI